MKKVIITAALLTMGYAASSGQDEVQVVQNSLFQKYIYKSLYTKVKFTDENAESLIKVKFNVTENGLDSIKAEGGSELVNRQIESVIRNTPEYIVGIIKHSDAKKVVVPVRLIVRKD